MKLKMSQRTLAASVGAVGMAVLLAACGGGGGDGAGSSEGGGSTAQSNDPASSSPVPVTPRVAAAFVPGAKPSAWWRDDFNNFSSMPLGTAVQQADGSYLQLGSHAAPAGTTTAEDVAGDASYAIGTWPTSPRSTYVVYNSPAATDLPPVGVKTCTTLAQAPSQGANQITATLTVTPTDLTLAPIATVASVGASGVALPTLDWPVKWSDSLVMSGSAMFGTSVANSIGMLAVAGGADELLVVYRWNLSAAYGSYGATSVLSCK